MTDVLAQLLAAHSNSDPALRDRMRQLGRALFARLAEATTPPFIEVSLGDWRPRPLMCAANAQFWADNKSGWTRARGWTYQSLGNRYPFVEFAVHNIVRNPEGQLLDITPDWSGGASLFLEHWGVGPRARPGSPIWRDPDGASL